MQKILRTFTHLVDVDLDNIEIEELIKTLNLHYVNDEHCNHIVNGQMVAKYPEIEKSCPEFVESHYNVRRGFRVKLSLDLLSDGRVVLSPNFYAKGNAAIV